jgi:hypothetical protein
MVAVKVRLDNPGELKMGMFARLQIITSSHLNALVIPKKALIGEESNQAWVAKGDKGEFRELKTGIQDEQYVEVLEGISADEMVITEGQTALSDKSRIKVVNSPTRPGTQQKTPPENETEKKDKEAKPL